jgi:hypothetical protein
MLTRTYILWPQQIDRSQFYGTSPLIIAVWHYACDKTDPDTGVATIDLVSLMKYMDFRDEDAIQKAMDAVNCRSAASHAYFLANKKSGR